MKWLYLDLSLLCILYLILFNINNIEYKYAKASYYHDSFNGNVTASSKIFDNNKLVAAHKTLPFGTKVKIINPINNKYVIVTIIDRGPFIKNREFDLSKKAFDSISNLNKGVIKIKYKIL